MKRTLIPGICAAVVFTVLTSGAAWADESGPQTFIVHATGYPEHNDVVAIGPILGRGLEIVSEETSEQNVDGTETFTQLSQFVLERGSVFLSIRGTDRTEVDERTCVGSTRGSVSWTLLPEQSTGDYADVTGQGTGTFIDRFVVPHDATGCVHEPIGTNVFVARLHGRATILSTVAA